VYHPQETWPYLKISEFARLARVSVKALHHYDEIGLSGRRMLIVSPLWYDAIDQLPRLIASALRDLGSAWHPASTDDDVSACGAAACTVAQIPERDRVCAGETHPSRNRLC
jgi:hypothetical protein